MTNPSSFRDIALSNPDNARLIKALASLDLPQCYLTAGCLFQSFWNALSGRPLSENIKDYDVFYFDGSDVSWEAEDKVIRRVVPLAEALGLPIEVKNQARVHLWYKERFGSEYPQLHSSQDGMARYLVRCTCIGINVATGEVFAPDGFADLEAGILRMNPLMPRRNLWRDKAEAYRSRWPWLTLAED